MRTFHDIVIVFFLSIIFLTGCDRTATSGPKVGISIPIEHQAMNDIVQGFKESLKKQYGNNVFVKVANAQGDLNIQRAIIQQMKSEHYDVIVPIGTDATQMTLAAINQQPIVSLAANFSETDRHQKNPCHLVVVHDEIAPAKFVQFIHVVYPERHQFVLIHSPAEKIYAQVKETVIAGDKIGLKIKPIMVPTLNELYSVAHALPAGTEGILVLKDHLIVSGISTLTAATSHSHIPLITSDQGSVEGGATFALGVEEKQIGAEGAQLVAKILRGQPICSLANVDMHHLTVFVNLASLKNVQQPIKTIEAAAQQLSYQVQIIKTQEAAHV